MTPAAGAVFCVTAVSVQGVVTAATSMDPAVPILFTQSRKTALEILVESIPAGSELATSNFTKAWFPLPTFKFASVPKLFVGNELLIYVSATTGAVMAQPVCIAAKDKTVPSSVRLHTCPNIK